MFDNEKMDLKLALARNNVFDLLECQLHDDHFDVD